MSTLRCPVCESRLVFSHKGNYPNWLESFEIDHAEDPNEFRVIEKDAYKCGDPQCISNTLEVCWIESGEWFSGSKHSRFKTSEILKEKTGFPYAIGSFNHHYHIGLDRCKKKSFWINLYWWWIHIEAKPRGGDLPNEKSYLPHPFKRKISIWKTVEDGRARVSMTFFFPKLIYIFEDFNRKVNRLFSEELPDNEKNQLKEEILAMTEGKLRLSLKPAPNYMKVFSWYVKIFKKSLIKKIQNQ